MKIFIDTDAEGRVISWGSSPISTECVEVEIPEDHGLFSYPYEYLLVDGQLIKDDNFKLQQVKADKFKELSIDCQAAIFGYFDADYRGVTYTFSYDQEAQANFTGCLALFNSNLIEGMEWTAHKDGSAHRIYLEYGDFLPILSKAFQHKGSKVTRLRNELEIQLKAAATIEEVQAITW